MGQSRNVSITESPTGWCDSRPFSSLYFTLQEIALAKPAANVSAAPKGFNNTYILYAFFLWTFKVKLRPRRQWEVPQNPVISGPALGTTKLICGIIVFVTAAVLVKANFLE